MSPQDGLGEPVPHGSFAAWADRPVDRGDYQVLTGSQPLPAFGAMPVDMLDEFSASRFLPESLRQSPLEDLGGNGRWPTPVTAATMSSSLPRYFCQTRRQRLSTQAHFE